jgi:predicted porin
MKKSLFALAAVTAFAGAAQAQSSVTVYGLIDMGIAGGNTRSQQATSVTNATALGVNQAGQSTGRLGFRGNEDLGGGKAAFFHIEYDLVDLALGGNGQNGSATAADVNPNTGATASAGFAARLGYIGLRDKAMGEVRLGRQAQLIHTVIANGLAGAGNNVAGSFYSSGTNSMVNTASIRPHLVFVNRAVTYFSPNIGGVVVGLQTSNQSVSTADNVASTTTNESSASLAYTGIKDLNVQAAITKTHNVTGTATANNVQLSALSANYNFGVLQAFGVAAQNKTTDLVGANFAKTTTYELGARAPITPAITLFASGFTGNRDGGSASTSAVVTGANAITAATGDGDVSGFQLGTIYSLSKRSSLYAIYGQQAIKGKSAQTGYKVESTGMAVGMRHSF